MTAPATTRGPAPTGTYFPGSRRKPIAHGTGGGYRAHHRYGEPMCDACRDHERKRRGHKGPQKVAECGTRSGYNRHLRRGETPCEPCAEACRVAGQERRAAR